MHHQMMEESSCTSFNYYNYLLSANANRFFDAKWLGSTQTFGCNISTNGLFVIYNELTNMCDHRDLVFIQDCTGSQGSYITSSTKNIEEISRAIFESGKLVYPDDLRLGLIAFRDHPPQDHTYITKNFGFSSGVA